MHALALLLHAALPALCRPAEQPWLSFDAATAPPLRFETKIPAEAALVDGPAGRRAVSVTVPDMGRDEKACAFALSLPELEGPFNAVRLWVKGTERTKRLEIVFRTAAGDFGADIPLEPQWREVALSAQNTRPYFGTKEGRLSVTQITGARFCFGEWQGNTGGPHTVSLGPLTAEQSPRFIAPGPVETRERPQTPLPLQPFTVELLDLLRGRWQFDDALGQHLSLEGPVTGYAFAGDTQGETRLAYLCCDPEFADDLDHAVLRIATAAQSVGEARWFRVEEPYFAATVEVKPTGAGVLRCALQTIALGPATTGDRYVAALYVLVGEKPCLVWLSPDPSASGLRPRLLTDRVGNVFVEGEPVRVTLVSSGLAGAVLPIRVTDYATRETVWSGPRKMTGAPGTLSTDRFTVPLSRFGVFEVSAGAPGGPPATLRVCRVPRPRTIDPDRSSIGINLFQQQIWWYAYQAPLMAKAGVRWIRPWLAWENAWSTQEPQPGRWDTRALDAALRRTDACGQRYQLILWSAPDWVSRGATCGAPPVEKLDLWAAYVERLVRQYRGRVRCYEVWNEPDLMWPETSRHSGEHYLALLKVTWAAARRADPDCQVLGLSHAGYEEWLERVGKFGAGGYFDVAAIHCYAPPHDFVSQIERRRAIMARTGMAGKPIWINELGSTAYDFSRAYSARFGCSERQQASHLPALYAQALSFDPKMKAFWFCTYDPRDAAHESQWTWDCGVGVLYLGFLPKLSYAALAGAARQLDGRRCLGRLDLSRDLHQVSFEGPVAVVWHDRPKAGALPATDLGCLPDEAITARDMFTNRVAAGKAGAVSLDLSRGTLYLEGSREMAACAQAEAAVAAAPREVSASPGGTATVRLTAPPEAKVSVDPEPGLPLAAEVRSATGGREILLTVRADVDRTNGVVRIRARFQPSAFGLRKPREVVREVTVSVGAPNPLRDGGFFLGDLSEWAPERTSAYAWDAQVGHAAPGSLRLDAPFDRRLVHWNVLPTPGRPLRFRCWVKTDRLQGGRATLNIAFFGPEKWLETWCLATSGEPGEIEGGWRTMEQHGHIPSGTNEWTLVEAHTPPVPAATSRAAFFVDVKGGEGCLWIDDLDLWQEQGAP